VVVAETAGLTGNLTTPVEGGYTRVVDRNGSDVLDSRGEGLHTQYAEGSGDSGPVAAGLAGNVGITDGTAAAGTDGQLVAYAPAGDTSWAVLVHAPRGAAFQLRSTISTNLLLLLAGALGGLTLIGLTLGRGTVRSLRTLTTKAEQLQDGNLEIDVESDRSDEIGQLFAAFGNMRDSLRAQITEAEDAKEQATAAKERAETARTEAEAARQEAEALATDLEQKADEYSAVMARCADGDLTQRLPTDADNEAMCEIARSFNRMLDDLEATVGEVTSFADLVAASSRETEANIEAANAGAGGSADGDGVAVVADEVKALASETKDSAAEIEALVEDVRAETEQAVTAMRETKRLVSRSVDTVGDVKTTREQRARANDLEDLVDQYVVDTDAEATDGNSTDARTGAEN
jgi:methyl-accepting chemotaxis protein